MPPSITELKKRLKRRAANNGKEIKNRMKVARKEMACLPMYDYSVVNDSIKNAMEHLEAIVKAERRKTGAQEHYGRR